MESQQFDYYEEPLYLYTLDCYRKKIILASTREEKYIALNEAYQFVKDISNAYYHKGVMHPAYITLKDRLLKCEKNIPLDFIIASNPNYVKSLPKPSSSQEDSEILDWIVNNTRRYIANKNPQYVLGRRLLEDLSFMNFCKVSANKVEKLCNNLGICGHKAVIYPGFAQDASLLDGYGYHYFNIVFLKQRAYIVDCTYRQFFTERGNSLNRLGIVGIFGCLAGRFMTMTEERYSMATDLLQKGYVPATDENLKAYFDGFALSYRNGLYYEETGDFSFTTPYSAVDYLDFLSGNDSQIAHESTETLGFQERPLKDPKIFVKK